MEKFREELRNKPLLILANNVEEITNEIILSFLNQLLHEDIAEFDILLLYEKEQRIYKSHSSQA